ncbi:hypothetical protein KC19_7G111200 [Ceratodon purpureus]|uniref:Uncharacterized protein n=1 Tax=Ceratodon purpureus TaxID=3225 RepID=A0A8T0H9U2_CERPU|nr:hypothetical protein KC19_7G111200 [Ceratodon purpureus]
MVISRPCPTCRYCHHPLIFFEEFVYLLCATVRLWKILQCTRGSKLPWDFQLLAGSHSVRISGMCTVRGRWQHSHLAEFKVSSCWGSLTRS